MKQITLFLAFLLSATVAFAGPGKKKDEMKRGERMRKELNLTDEQVVKMKAIREKKKTTQQEARQKVKGAREALHTTMANPKATDDELKNKFQALQDAQAAKNRAKFETMLEIRSILNESQRAKFHEKRKELRKKFGEKRKHHGDEDSE